MSNRNDAIWLLLVLGVGLAVVLAAHVAGVVICPFRRLTGIPCPCCGMTRACLAILRGDVAAALEINPLSIVAVSIMAVIVGLTIWRKTCPRIVVVLASIVFLVALVLNWAYILFRD